MNSGKYTIVGKIGGQLFFSMMAFYYIIGVMSFPYVVIKACDSAAIVRAIIRACEIWGYESVYLTYLAIIFGINVIVLVLAHFGGTKWWIVEKMTEE